MILPSLRDRARPCLFVTLLLAGFVAGCGEDDPVTPPDDPCVNNSPVLPHPASATQLMENYRSVYEMMDFDDYLRLLHPDFEMFLQAETTQEFPDVGTSLDLAEETDIAAKMFSGHAVTNSSGQLVPGISSINFELFEQRGAWTTTLPGDLIEGVLAASFEVRFLFDRGSDSTLRVDGLLRFYVTSRDTVICGTSMPYHELVGIQDQTGFKGVEVTNFGSIKALFY
ncbi:hypothetical protein KDM41_11885 [bacterium]|nr:hypothetical protein [bacterium]